MKKKEDRLFKDDIKALLSTIPLSKDEYVVILDAAMCLQDIIKYVTSVDISCNQQTWDELIIAGHQPSKRPCGFNLIAYTDKIFYHLNSSSSKVAWLSIDGYSVQTINSLIAEKGIRATKKDIKDMKLIYRYTKKYPVHRYLT